MKFNDEKHIKNETVSPQSAMDDYFGDMFGSAEEDPLKKLESQDESLKFLNKSTTDIKLVDDSRTYPVAETKPQRKDPEYNQSAPKFDEPVLAPKNISPLIIAATFPKLAPPKEELKSKTSVDTLQSEKTQTTATKPLPKVAVEPKQVVKTKLDAKTALALLNKQKSKLSLAQKQRLKEKLKSLSKVRIDKKVQQNNKVQVSTSQTKPEVSLQHKQKTKLDSPQVKPVLKTALKEKEEQTIAVTNTVSTPSEVEAQPNKNNLPEWADKRFECLIFSVAGLKLAVPLLSLGAIYKVEKDFIPIVGRANWFMGLYHHLDRNVRVIDTAQWVMPERCSDQVRLGYKFIIRLGGNNWGLACDAVHESIQLNPDQIKWRTERTKREWLFGTVIDHMCALIDVDSLSATLELQANKNPSIFS